MSDMFMSKVYADPNTGCWLWGGSANKQGYGNFWMDKKCQKAHRVSYKLFVGPLSGDLDVMHTCDFPSCVNPAHLKAGTTKDNMRDMWAKGRGNPPAGTRNRHAKLTEFGVRYVRDMLALGFTKTEIAKRFQLSTSTISRIGRGEIWRAS